MTGTDQNFDKFLRRALHRQSCPEPEILGDLALGLLPSADVARVRTHLESCPWCQAELSNLTGFVAEEAITWTTIREWAVRAWRDAERALRVTLRPPAGLAWQPAMGLAVRGDAVPEKRVLRYINLGTDELDDMAIEAEVTLPAEDAQQCDVRVRVDVPSRWPELSGMTVTASAAEWHTAAQTDERGEVVLTGLPRAWVDELVIDIQR